MRNETSILLVYPVDFSQKINQGILNKRNGQFKAFQALGYRVKCAQIDGTSGVISSESDSDPSPTIFVRSSSQYFLKFESFYSSLHGHIDDVEIIYIRHLLHTHSLYRFLKYARSQGKLVLYEYPTYPYQPEWTKWWQKILLRVDQYYFNRCEVQKDLVIHLGGYNGRSGKLRITNGIDPIDISIKRKKSLTPTYVMVAMGRWEYWHGLDRVMRGMAVSNKEYFLKIIGDGPALEEYKTLVRELGISELVSFYPPTFGSDLESLVNNADLGVSTLGLHRKNVSTDSSLKSRTYCAMGLPFVHAATDDDFPDSLPFTFRVAGDDSIINVDGLFEKLEERLQQQPVKLSSHSIQQYATTQLTWLSRTKKIHDKIVHLMKLD